MFAFCKCIWYTKNMNTNDIFSAETKVTHGRGYVYSLQYHIVWCTKYRKKVLNGIIEKNVAKVPAELLKNLPVLPYIIQEETAKNLQMEIIAMEIMPDHIHILADCKPQLRLSDAIKVLKGNTSRWLFMAHPEIKQQLWGGHLWNPSYFVATVSDRGREQVTAYINNQKSK